MKYSVDKIENDIVVLESIENSLIKEESLLNIPFDIEENDILLFDGKKYIKDELTKEERIKRIREKMNKLNARNN